ncbi:MAG: hypothetical protein CYPHOPRED_001854 [Cyphobasidiales sp. Tagirdzhanova-0007]|nr:MAG: hypothetical protein CYPHOPRED_001854 [Cyphobasidiales sp. Tagirdzhanova-0007]
MRRSTSISRARETDSHDSPASPSASGDDHTLALSPSTESLASTSSERDSIPEEDQHMLETIPVPSETVQIEGQSHEPSNMQHERQESEQAVHSPQNGYAFALGGRGVGSGEATPQQQHSPPPDSRMGNHTGPYMTYTGQRSQPGSGTNTPRRRMSMTDLRDEQHAINRKGHQQAILGFDESFFNSQFGDLDLYRLGSMSDGESEEDVPIPDSAQVRAGEMEVVEASRLRP